MAFELMIQCPSQVDLSILQAILARAWDEGDGEYECGRPYLKQERHGYAVRLFISFPSEHHRTIWLLKFSGSMQKLGFTVDLVENYPNLI